MDLDFIGMIFETLNLLHGKIDFLSRSLNCYSDSQQWQPNTSWCTPAEVAADVYSDKEIYETKDAFYAGGKVQEELTEEQKQEIKTHAVFALSGMNYADEGALQHPKQYAHGEMTPDGATVMPTPKETYEMKEEFDLFESDGSGSIASKELKDSEQCDDEDDEEDASLVDEVDEEDHEAHEDEGDGEFEGDEG